MKREAGDARERERERERDTYWGLDATYRYGRTLMKRSRRGDDQISANRGRRKARWEGEEEL